MVNFLKLLLINLLLMVALPGLGQRPADQRLYPGDYLPDIGLGIIINYDLAQPRLAEFRSELLLIVFWDVGCAPCIASFPKLEELQKKFDDEIQILLVTKSTENQVRRLFKRSAIARDCRLPMVVEDTVLSGFFPHQTVPAYVWIDQSSMVRYFSSDYTYIEEYYIREFLSGSILKMNLKDEYGDFNPSASLLFEGNGRNLSKIESYSFFTRRVNFDSGFVSRVRDPQTGETAGLLVINHTLPELFLLAWQDSLSTGGFRIGAERVLYENSGEKKLLPSKDNRLDSIWKEQYLFCYEARLPKKQVHRLYLQMRFDLFSHFGIRATVERKTKKCLVLKVIDPKLVNEKLLSHPDGLQYKQFPLQGDTLYLRNMNYASLLNGIELLFGDQFILVNETDINMSEPLTIRLEGNLRDLSCFRRYLTEYGLDLVPQYRKVPFLKLNP